jgi:alkanesulfonate monooxygenase SsuD/methylene tetrahydromethanopterin reductase-like flavin-dependent oxidoreductase (luciferase family)
MQIGLGLPSTIPGAQGTFILDWARRADSGPFSSLGVLDRLVYPNYDPLTALAAAAAVTQRVRLITTILIAPLRGTSILAKQTASIDALSNGRLTLGLAVGGREDDYRAASVEFHERGKIFDEQLATMKQIWEGQTLSGESGPIGPSPVQAGGPELLIGGNTPVALKRVGQWGNGYIVGGGGPQMAQQGFLTVALFYELSSTIITFFEENTTAHKAHVLLDPTHSPLRQTDQDRPAQVSGGVPKAG